MSHLSLMAAIDALNMLFDPRPHSLWVLDTASQIYEWGDNQPEQSYESESDAR